MRRFTLCAALLCALVSGGCQRSDAAHGAPESRPALPTFDRTCAGLCAQLQYCAAHGGPAAPPAPTDCAAACASGGALDGQLAAMRCLGKWCEYFAPCVSKARAEGSGAQRPAGYPEGFPLLPGGEPIEGSSVTGPSSTVMIGYNLDGAVLAAQLEAAAKAAGWKVESDSALGEGKRRTVFTKGDATVRSLVVDTGRLTSLHVLHIGR